MSDDKRIKYEYGTINVDVGAIQGLGEMHGLANIIQTETLHNINDMRDQFGNDYGHFWGPPQPPLTRKQRIRRRLTNRIQDARENVALRIAPWLDNADRSW